VRGAPSLPPGVVTVPSRNAAAEPPSRLGLQAGSTIRLGVKYVEDGARVIVDGRLCESCTWVRGLAPETGEPIIDVTLGEPLAPGVHVVQLLNPDGWMSNEMPVLAQEAVR